MIITVLMLIFFSTYNYLISHFWAGVSNFGFMPNYSLMALYMYIYILYTYVVEGANLVQRTSNSMNGKFQTWHHTILKVVLGDIEKFKC